MKLHRDFSGRIKTVTIKKMHSEDYYVSVLVEMDDVLPQAASICPEHTLGINHVLIDSDGHKVEKRIATPWCDTKEIMSSEERVLESR